MGTWFKLPKNSSSTSGNHQPSHQSSTSAVIINQSHQVINSGSLNQCVLLFGALSKRETFCVRSHTVKRIWKCRPPGGRHFDVGFINQALLAKVSPLDKAPFCGTKKKPLLVVSRDPYAATSVGGYRVAAKAGARRHRPTQVENP